MDYLPGNPWIYDNKEKQLEELRIRRIEIYLQWKMAELSIKDIIDNNNIWELCDINMIYLFNHRTERFIKYTKQNSARISSYSDFNDFIYLEFMKTTGWYNIKDHVHIPDKAIYKLYNSKINLLIEVDNIKRGTFDWEYTIEEKLNNRIKYYLDINNLLEDQIFSLQELIYKIKNTIKKDLNIQLDIFENISNYIPEGEYLKLMNTLKRINDSLTY